MGFRVWLALSLGLCSSTLSGCSPGVRAASEPVLHPVRGKVSVQGKPLAQAVVTFLQVDEKGTTAVGETDDDGEYVLSYLQRPGTAAADYKVAVSYIQGTDGTVYGLGPRSGLAKPYGFVTAPKECLRPSGAILDGRSRKPRSPLAAACSISISRNLCSPLLSRNRPRKKRRRSRNRRRSRSRPSRPRFQALRRTRAAPAPDAKPGTA